MAPELLALAVIGLALTLYALLGGADFGAGIWEFNTAFQASERERALIQRAVGPVWEANHVWLIFALVVTHAAFPLAYQAVSQALWLPLLFALTGIVFRGVGFVFRAYAAEDSVQRPLWGAVFALASTAAPFFFGACVGAITSGRLALDGTGQFVGDFLTGWIQPLGIFTAFFAVGVSSYLEAVYFTREAERAGDALLTDVWRRRALATGAWMGILAAVGLAFLAIETPRIGRNILLGWELVAASAAAGAFSLWALSTRRFTAAAFGAAGAVVTVMVAWMIAQYPYLVPPTVTVDLAAGPENVIRAVVLAASAGTLLLVPALFYLFYLFKWKRAGDRTSRRSARTEGCR